MLAPKSFYQAHKVGVLKAVDWELPQVLILAASGQPGRTGETDVSTGSVSEILLLTSQSRRNCCFTLS